MVSSCDSSEVPVKISVLKESVGNGDDDDCVGNDGCVGNDVGMW